MLWAEHISKRHGIKNVVNGVSLYLSAGEVVALLGPNGAGKTTMFRMLTGVEAPDKGRVFLENEDVTDLPLFERARRGLSYLPQEPSLFRGLTVEQNILVMLEVNEPDAARRRAILDSLLSAFGIQNIRRSRASKLSGGQRRRCEIARALATRPRFILLDEPFAGVDPIAVNEVRALIALLARRGIGVLITDHNVRETLRIVDRAYIMEGGRIFAEGTVDEVVANPEARRVYLDHDFRL